MSALRAARGLVRHMPNLLFKEVIRSFMHCGHDRFATAQEALPVRWRHYAAHCGASAFAQQVVALRNIDTLEVAKELPRLGVPARIAWGAADGFLKIGWGERFAQDLDAPLRRIDGGKHLTPEDHPDIVADEIEQLIAVAGFD